MTTGKGTDIVATQYKISSPSAFLAPAEANGGWPLNLVKTSSRWEAETGATSERLDVIHVFWSCLVPCGAEGHPQPGTTYEWGLKVS